MFTTLSYFGLLIFVLIVTIGIYLRFLKIGLI